MNKFANKVKAYNQLIDVMDEMMPELKELVVRFEGKKVVNKGRTFSKAFLKEYNEIRVIKPDNVQLYYTFYSCDVTMNFRISYAVGDHTCDYIIVTRSWINCECDGMATVRVEDEGSFEKVDYEQIISYKENVKDLAVKFEETIKQYCDKVPFHLSDRHEIRYSV